MLVALLLPVHGWPSGITVGQTPVVPVLPKLLQLPTRQWMEPLHG